MFAVLSYNGLVIFGHKLLGFNVEIMFAVLSYNGLVIFGAQATWI